MNTQEIAAILHEHEKWIKAEGGKRADLYGADLCGADLRGADLCSADLSGAENLNIPLACPDTGSFIGWKKASGLIVKLLIPSDAKRLSATGRKCRCNKAHEPYVNGGCKDAHGNYRRFQGRKERDPKTRSKTFPGIAQAMAEQWGGRP